MQGITLETRLNYDGILQLDAGFTYQSSKFNTAVDNFHNLSPKREFLRTPSTYGYATATYTPNQKFKTALNLVYTGQMDVLHIIPNPDFNPPTDNNENIGEYFSSPSFFNLGVNTSYTFNVEKLNTNIELNAGIKNILDDYQSEFDKGKDRDSNFIFGPATPRIYVLGLKFISN